MIRMKFFAAAIVAVFGAGTALAYPFDDSVDRARALAPPSPYDFGGDKCQGLAEGTPNVWHGRFAGGRSKGVSVFGNDRRIKTHTSEGCFKSPRACEAWMYALKSRYSAKPIYNYCQAGYDPGSDIPPWWAPKG